MVMPNRRKPREPDLTRHDGGLCPSFVNTANAKRAPIDTYADLIAWGERSGALGDADARRLERAAADRPEAAGDVVREATKLRGVMERILVALIAGEEPRVDDIAALNVVAGQVLANRRLVPAGDGYHRWGWDDRGGNDLDRMLWPVVLSAAEILTSRFRRLVGRCGGEGCGLIFVDRTPGSPRKWCRECGRRVRHRRHYLRQKRERMTYRKALEEKKPEPGEDL